jgi:hypothetical protein
VSGVSDVSVAPHGEGTVRVVANVAGDDVREAAVKALVERGLGVRSVADAAGDLESVFLKLTKKEAA